MFSRLKGTAFVLLVVIGSLTGIITFAQDQLSHVVQPGENLFRIALRYGVDMNTLAAANNIADARRIFSGQVLTIPGLSVPDASPSVENPLVAVSPIVHVVQRGETLRSIATQYNLTVDQILQANNISNANLIYTGQSLNIWSNTLTAETPAEASAPAEAPAAEAAPAEQPVAESTSYVVQAGEHLSQIAQRFGVNWTTIAEANGITNPNFIYAGMTLIIPGSNGAVTYTAAAAPNAPSPVVGVGREIVVDLSDSAIYAYEDGALQRTVIVSTGLPATPTVQGNFNVYMKLDEQTMSGPGYYLPGVPWVMYFYQGYAIHGTYWHSNFGQPMSHGCVNLPTLEAAWFYSFATVGTPVNVQY